MNRHSPLLKLPYLAILYALLSGALFGQQVAPEILALEKSVMDTVTDVKDSVIAIEVMGANGQASGSGSGVIVSADGLILTAAHVVDNQDSADAILADGTRHEIKVLGMNRYKDAAVCRFIDQDRSWPYTPMGNSDTAKVTEWVIAMGHGRGYDKTRSAPVRFGRIRAHNPGRFLTTNCPLIGGDSGGPLFNLKGEVIGINSSINGLAKFNVHAGISGFIDDLHRMEAGERWGKLLPNVEYTPETPALNIEFYGNNYADPRPIIYRVTKGGPADLALLRPGDLILQIDDERVNTKQDVTIALGRKKAGDTVGIIVQRGTEMLKTKATLTQRKTLNTRQQISAPRLHEREDSPYVRERDIPLLEKQTEQLRTWINPLAAKKAETFIQLYDQGDISRPLLNATIIDENTAIAPLSAFLTLPRNLLAWRPGIDAYPVELLGGYEEHDLAVLRISGLSVKEKVLANATNAKVGQFLAAVANENNTPSVIRLGVVSVEERNLKALLGVRGSDDDKVQGALLGKIEPNSTAKRMGLRQGDIVTHINEVRIKNFTELGNEIQKLQVGDKISVEYQRNKKRYKTKDNVGVKSNASPRINNMDQLGRNSLSRNTDTFRTVIQSDILVEPEECGSPIFSLKGEFIGMAISDAGRNKSYILPAKAIEEALNEKPAEISRQNLAKNTITPRPQMRNPYNRQGSRQREFEEIQRMQREHIERFYRDSQNPSSDIFDQFFENFFGR